MLNLAPPPPPNSERGASLEQPPLPAMPGTPGAAPPPPRRGATVAAEDVELVTLVDDTSFGAECECLGGVFSDGGADDDDDDGGADGARGAARGDGCVLEVCAMARVTSGLPP